MHRDRQLAVLNHEVEVFSQVVKRLKWHVPKRCISSFKGLSGVACCSRQSEIVSYSLEDSRPSLVRLRAVLICGLPCEGMEMGCEVLHIAVGRVRLKPKLVHQRPRKENKKVRRRAKVCGQMIASLAG